MPTAKQPPAKRSAAKTSAESSAAKRSAAGSEPAGARQPAKRSVAKRPAGKQPPARRSAADPTGSAPKLLSGGNPQIPKGDGDAPVQAYIAAMPGWKHDIGTRIDAIVERLVPGVAKAVKWNTPFYGVEPDSWFLSYHCFDRYVKVTFFRGTSLDPVPPGASKTPETRYYDVHEEALDEELFAEWVRQAAALPGEKL